MVKATEIFCCQALGAPRRDELGIKKVSRVKPAPRGIAYLEVLVEFVDTCARDDILVRGPMLAEYRDSTNRPTAGLRLDIPSHLMGVFKTLEAFGYALKKRHQVNFRKHIKFDEFAETLYIQVGRREEDGDMDWTEYTADEAREGLKKLNAKKGPRLDFLASPPTGLSDSAASTSTAAAEKNSTRMNKNRFPTKSGSGIPWIPPARKNGTQPRNNNEEEEMA